MADSQQIAEKLGCSLHNPSAHFPNNNTSSKGVTPHSAPTASHHQHRHLGSQPILADAPYVPSYNPGSGLVLALNPSQNNEFSHAFNQNQNSTNKRPWWMWAISVIDIIAAIFFAGRLGVNIVEADRSIVADRNAFMWILFLMFISLAGQFMMGMCLFIGLKSTNVATTIWVCQGWICGAYFMLLESSFVVLTTIMNLEKQGTEIGANVIMITKIFFRAISLFLVRRFMSTVMEATEESAAAKERFRHYCHQQLPQQQPLLTPQGFPVPQAPAPTQEFHQEQLLQQHQQLQMQHQLHPHQLNVQGGNLMPGGVLNSDYLYFAPQMSLLMSMMMNNSSGSTTN